MGFLKDSSTRWWLAGGFILALLLITPTILLHPSGTLYGYLIEYARELGFAILVAIPVLLTVEVFNQRRIAQLEKETLEKQARVLVFKGLPELLITTIQDTVVDGAFYRSGYKVSYTLTPWSAAGTPAAEGELVRFVKLNATHQFRVHARRNDKKTFRYETSLSLDGVSRHHAKFLGLTVGPNHYNPAQLAEMADEIDANLMLVRHPDFAVSDVGLLVQLDTETVYPIESPFEAIITSMPSENLVVRVNAPHTLKVSLDTLHQKPMRPHTPPDTGFTHQWVQDLGLFEGQGAMLRWAIQETALPATTVTGVPEAAAAPLA